MAPVTNSRHLYNELIKGLPEPGKTTVHDTSQTIDLERVALNGGFLVKTLVLSMDPYIRGRMRDPKVKSYIEPFNPGEPVQNFGVGVVLRSENSAVKVGEHIYGLFPFQEYVIVNEPLMLQRTLKNEEGLPWSAYLGVCGMPGQTAFHAWNEYAKPEKGDVVFVTAGAGPVGATVVQLAKALGLKVIASAGSDEKVAFIKSIGADVAFNYKTTNTIDVLQKEGPINIYWDNVGGETLDAALAAAARHARFIECGMISVTAATPYTMKNLPLIVGKELKISGFIVSSLHHKYLSRFYAEIPARVARGEIKYIEDVTEGLEHSCEALLDVVTGRNKGKSVILVARE